MPDLHAWITCRIGEVERIAEAARGQGEGRWRHDSSYYNGYVYDDGDQPVVYDESAPLPEEAAHIALNDPESVLRRCAVDRKILAAHPYTTRVITPSDGSASAGFGCDTCHNWDGVPEGRGNCATVLALAEAYGYDEGRPDA